MKSENILQSPKQPVAFISKFFSAEKKKIKKYFENILQSLSVENFRYF